MSFKDGDFIPPYPDPFGDGESFKEVNKKLVLLTQPWNDVQAFKFPSRYASGRFRTPQPAWFTSYSWLRYSVKLDGVFCAPCFLCSGSDPRSKALTTTVVTDWSNIKKILDKHGKSDLHISSSIAAENFVAIQNRQQKDIECSISSAYNALVEKNRKIMALIVDTLMLCGKQNIPIRGHREDADSDRKGNFQALLEFQAKNNPVLKDHLENGDPRTRYTSPKIQNEIIAICGKLISDEIVTECNQSQMFSLIADEATDCATMEQMALCVRYLKDSEIREEFLGFSECKSTTGEALANAFLENLRCLGVQMDYIRGQGYDGASNMSGLYRGVQARIRQQYPEAVYTHCKAHCLNLAIVHASNCTYVRNMIATVQTVAFAFNMSAKRLLNFQETLGCDPTSREEMEERQKLQSLCETRWAARADALHTFLCSYRTVVTSLEDLGANGDTKAAAYSLSVLKFDFIITLVTAEHVLAALVGLSTMLQQKACDLLRAATETRVVIATLKNERGDTAVWDSLYQKAVDLASNVGVDPCIPRNVGRQRNRPNGPSDTSSQFWKINMYYPFLDHLLTELENRLLQANPRYNAQMLIPSQVSKSGLPVSQCRELYRGLQTCLDVDEDIFLRECVLWRTWWTDPTLAAQRETTPENLTDSLKVTSEALYPNIRKCLALLMVVPVSTATAERSFSTMRRVKSYLRSTMTTERLSGLGLLNIYQEKKLDAERIVDIFAAKKERRLALIFKV